MVSSARRGASRGEQCGTTDPAYLRIIDDLFCYDSVVGPLVGGVCPENEANYAIELRRSICSQAFTDHVSWRWYVRLPRNLI